VTRNLILLSEKGVRKGFRRFLSFLSIFDFRLEALPVNDGRSRLIVLLLGDPHLLEGGEGGKN